MEKIRLYVGLGNPVRLLRNTRHNLGYLVVDSFLERSEHKEYIKEETAFKGLYSYDDGFNKCYLLKPYCSINKSGEYVRQVVTHLNLENVDVSVFYDDMDEEIGACQKERFLFSDNTMEHYGVKSVAKDLGGVFINAIGVGKPKDGDIYNHVLGDFNKDEIDDVFIALDSSVNYIKYCVGIR